MNPKTQEAFDNILNTCGGADNSKFISWMEGVRHLDAEGSEKADLILDIMIKFSNMLDILHQAKGKR